MVITACIIKLSDDDDESAEQLSQIQSSQSTGINLIIQDQRGILQDPKEQFVNQVRKQ
jgi:hypothetical protein